MDAWWAQPNPLGLSDTTPLIPPPHPPTATIGKNARVGRERWGKPFSFLPHLFPFRWYAVGRCLVTTLFSNPRPDGLDRSPTLIEGETKWKL